MSILAPDTEVELPLLPSAEPAVAPFINLLPPEIAERRAVRQLLGLLVVVLVVVLALTGGIVYLAGNGKAEAQASLSSQQAETQRLQRQVSSLSSAKQAQTELQAAKAALQAAMANEVLWSRYLDELRTQLPDGVRFTNVAIAPAGATSTTSSPATAATAATTAPASSNAVASITISGKAVSQDAVADWLDASEQDQGLHQRVPVDHDVRRRDECHHLHRDDRRHPRRPVSPLRLGRELT